jgi:3-hydroxyisobutyrate dehydrogenase-like beta-hydroxyacid dehydrogenase
MRNIGFIGLGGLGGEIAKRLLDKGYTVTGYNRTRSKAQWLVDQGMRWADSPRAVCASSDVTLSTVTDDAALSAIADGPDGILAGLSLNKIVAEMSTVSLAASRSLAERIREVGGDMVDAPVSGSKITLQQGMLSIMVGGRRETFERIKPLLYDIGRKVTYAGENGLGLALKIAINLAAPVQMLAFAEGVLLAEKNGISRDVAVDVLMNSVMASPMIQYRAPFILDSSLDVLFNVKMMQKDTLLALEMGRKEDVPLPTTAIANEFLTAAGAMGLEEREFSAVFDVLARMSGM